jgi:SAM-dependent methyltransferase
VLKLVARVARQLNWSRRRWSAASDQAFHDDLYRGGDYDPFSLAYPGYTTIRRFADLVEPHLPFAGFVLDLGCGPGEITCELAARRLDLQFLGVDHSEAAIAKASVNAARRGLSNVGFECADVEAYAPPRQIDLATLFDSFHHVIDPAGFIKRLSPHVSRWALIEPRGSWAGTWRKDLDFDWVAEDLDKIRAHVAYLCGEQSADGEQSAGLKASATSKTVVAPGFSPALTGAAVERRYTLDDFERFFDKRDGWTLDVRGTVAGLETYPPAANQGGELRERFGELRYQIYRSIDDRLLARDLDLHAKHWLIVAERGGRARHVNRSGRSLPQSHSDRFEVAGPYDVRYGNYRGPREAKPGERLMASVQLTNEGRSAWSSEAGAGVFASYHWLDTKGHVVDFDGERTPLPRTIAPGETADVALVVRAPTVCGLYTLAIDLVREGVTWFSEAGRPCLELPFKIR